VTFVLFVVSKNQRSKALAIIVLNHLNRSTLELLEDQAV